MAKYDALEPCVQKVIVRAGTFVDAMVSAEEEVQGEVAKTRLKVKATRAWQIDSQDPEVWQVAVKTRQYQPR